MRITLVCLFLAFACASAGSGFLSPEEEQYLRENPEIHFVSQSCYPPFEFIDVNGERQGMCIELVRWMSTKFGFQAILTDMTFQEAQEAILSGEADVITSFFYSEARDINYEFTEPMYTIPARIYVQPTTTDIVALTDLTGKRVAVQKGDYSIDFLHQEGISCTLVETDNFTDGVHLLLDGEVDALVGDEQIVDYHLLNHHTAGSILAVGDTLYVGQNCMSVAEGNEILVSIINKGIEHAIEIGIIDGIAMKWQDNPIAISYKHHYRFLPHLLTVLVFLLVSAILVFFWNLRLRQIVERKTISLEESEKRLSQALNQANLGSWDFNMQTGKVINNDQYSIMLGYSPGELEFSYEGWMNQIHPDDRKNLLTYMDSFLACNTGRFEHEYRMRTKEGAWVSIHSCGGIVERDAEGKVVRIAGIHQDITRRNHSEHLARKAVDDWENTFDAISEHIAVVDSEGVIIRVNKAQALALGMSRDECVGRVLHTLLYQDDDAESRCITDICAEGKKSPSQHEVYLKRFHGFFDVSISVLQDSEDDSIRIVRVAKDVTTKKQAEKHQKEMEARVQHAQKLESLGVLAGGIAHDFNNILMSIRGYTDLAIATVKTEDKAHEYLRQINKSVRIASELSGQMLAYSGKGNFVVETVYLNDIIKKIQPMFQVSVSRKVDLVLNLGRDMPYIRVDSTQMEQVILNLVTNASEAIGFIRGTITVTTGIEKRVHPNSSEEKKEEKKFAFFLVEDTGSGMSDDVVKKLFEPFFTTKFTGRGLGMAVVHGIVEGHNGFIEVHSEPEVGSSIKVFVPSVEEIGKKLKKEDEDDLIVSRETAGVLLVDDEKNILFIGKLALEKSGYTVFTAGNGEEALEIYRENRNKIQCVILDLTMPVMDGVECLKSLKKYDPEVKIILSSGYNQKDVESRIHIDDIAGYLKKPYGLNALRQQVKNITRG